VHGAFEADILSGYIRNFAEKYEINVPELGHTNSKAQISKTNTQDEAELRTMSKKTTFRYGFVQKPVLRH
jgi:hypothetical protein